MALSFVSMTTPVYIVNHNPHLKHDAYKVSLVYSLLSILFFTVLSVFASRGDAFELIWKLLHPKISLPIGICVGLNCVCLLLAGPYLPSPIQAIFSEAQLVTVYLVNLHFGNKPFGYQHAIVGFIIGINLSTIWNEGRFHSSLSGWILSIWCLVYLLNSLALGMANTLMEVLLEVFVVLRDDAVPLLVPHSNNNNVSAITRSKYSIWEFIFAIGVAVNIWAFVTSIPLSLLAWLAYGDDFKQHVFLDWSTFNWKDMKWVLIMGVASWIYTVVSYYMIKKTTALWVTVSSQLATIVKLIIFATITDPTYRFAPSVGGWISNSLVCFASLLYLMGSPQKHREEILNSRLGRAWQNVVNRLFQ